MRDRRAGWPTLALAQRGAGGTFTLGGGTGPATEPSTSATFERASATAGPYLTASYTAKQLGLFSTTFAFVVSSSTVAAQSWIRLRRPDMESSDGTPLLEIGCTAAGYLQIKSAYRAGFTAAGTVNIATDSPNPGCLQRVPRQLPLQGAFNDGKVDSVPLLTATTWGTDRVPASSGSTWAAQHPRANMASASISRLMLWGRAECRRVLSCRRHSRLHTDRPTGDPADRDLGGHHEPALQTGSVTSVAHQDTTGLAHRGDTAGLRPGVAWCSLTAQGNWSSTPGPTATRHMDSPRTPTLNEDVTFGRHQALINKAAVNRPAGAAQTFKTPPASRRTTIRDRCGYYSPTTRTPTTPRPGW